MASNMGNNPNKRHINTGDFADMETRNHIIAEFARFFGMVDDFDLRLT